MSWVLGALAVLVLWAGIAALRRRAEYSHGRTRRPPPPGPAAAREDGDDAIDYDALEQAEQEVRDLDAFQRPEQGFEGDDWGPGAPRGFPPVP